MKQSKRLKWWHRYLGLVMTLPLLLFALSGILLGHRRAISGLDIPRSYLPSAYRYHNWSQGAVRSALRLSPDSLLLYGSAGVWLTDSLGKYIRSASSSLPKGAEHRAILSMVMLPNGRIFALSSYHLYELDRASLLWQERTSRLGSKHRFADLTTQGDSLLVLSRSEVYTSTPPYEVFTPSSLPLAEGEEPSVSLFRTIWTLHSGELFGWAGIALVDLLGIALIVLLLTGIIIFVSPRLVRVAKRRKASPRLGQRAYRFGLSWHNKVGAITLVGMLILGISGAFLRPPLLIPIAKVRHTPLPLTTQSTPNAWEDKLRSLVFDRFNNRYLLYTSDGFYWLDSLGARPQREGRPPYVGFMGANVLHQSSATEWIVGSFAGLYRWNTTDGTSLNLYTGKPLVMDSLPKIPDFSYAITGYTEAFGAKALAFDYHRGAEIPSADGTAQVNLSMPKELERDGRISLWQLALEIHTGRIYTALPDWAGLLFIFCSGVGFIYILLSGYVVYRRHHLPRKTKPPR